MRAHAPSLRGGQDRWIPWTFVAAFAVILFANSCLVYFALSTWKGVGVEGAYERGLAYNDVLAAAERHDALGWRVDFAFTPAGAGTRSGRLVLDLHDRDGLTLGGATVDANLTRPLESLAPIALDLAERGEGRFEAAIVAPRAGQWDAKLVVRRGADTLEKTWRLFVP